MGFRVFERIVVHYFVYLDEFGHIGPFISRQDARHNTSPVFGLAGIVLPVDEIRNFSTYFYKLKGNLLKWEIDHDPKGTPAYQWEKKGSSLYTVKNIKTYPELRQATFRLINKIKDIDGFIFCNGIEKELPPAAHKPEALYVSILRDCIRRLDRYCTHNDASFNMFLDAIDSDEPGAKRKFRFSGISAASSEMFGLHHGNTCKTLLEPPYQLESHLYQNLQCADWFCGLLNKYISYMLLPDQYQEYKIIDTYFGKRLQGIVKAYSLRRRS